MCPFDILSQIEGKLTHDEGSYDPFYGEHFNFSHLWSDLTIFHTFMARIDLFSCTYVIILIQNMNLGIWFPFHCY